MRLIQLSDMLSFSAWDGVLVAALFFVSGILCRTLVKIMRKAGSKDKTLGTAYVVGTVIMTTSLVGGIGAWGLLPHNGPGAWGSAAILGIFLSYASAISFLRGGR
jgi:hypothetical protein